MKTFLTNLAIKILLLSIGYLSPIKYIFHAIWFLLVIDLITGLWKALKSKRYLTSKGLRATFEKFLGYTIGIAVSYVVDKEFMGLNLHLASIIGVYLALTESKSIFENLAVITNQDVFRSVLKYLQKAINSKLRIDK